MRFLQRHWKSSLWIGLALLALVSFKVAADNLFFTLTLLLNLREAARQHMNAGDPVARELSVNNKGQLNQAFVYFPQSMSQPVGVLFLPGLTEQGIRHPRFVAVAKALAKTGYVVLTPDIVSLRQFRLEQEAIEEITFWYHYMRNELVLGQVGITGVSVSGSLGLIAAARLPIHQEIVFVVSIGGYQDLLRCSRRWFSSQASKQRHGNYPVQHYGKWLIMLSTLDYLDNPSDRKSLAETLRHLLATGKPPKPPEHLTPPARRWFQAAISKDVVDQQLVHTIQARLAKRLAFLSPREELKRIRCPVFLVHGLYDELIPSGETLELQKRLTSAPTYVLLTPLISHTHFQSNHLKTGEKWLAYLRSAAFLHTFARIRDKTLVEKAGGSFLFPAVAGGR